jgi:hypothetical protein
MIVIIFSLHDSVVISKCEYTFCVHSVAIACVSFKVDELTAVSVKKPFQL